MKHKLKIGAMGLVLVVTAFNLYATLRLQGEVSNIATNTLSYIQTSNQTLEKIICAQQIQGPWDLTKCPTAQ